MKTRQAVTVVLMLLFLLPAVLCACDVPDYGGEIQSTEGNHQSPAPDPIDITEHGVPSDGSVDDVSGAISALLSEHASIYIPNGTYYLQNPIAVPSGARICSDDMAQLVVTGDHSAFVITSEIGTDGLPVFAEKIILSNLHIMAKIPCNSFAIDVKGVRDLLVNKVTVNRMSGVRIDTPYEIDYEDGSPDPARRAGVVSDECLSGEIDINYCRFNGMATDDHKQVGISIAYTNGFHVEVCTFKDLNCGIAVFGGDPDSTRGGSFENLGKCKNGQIVACELEKSTGDGIVIKMAEQLELQAVSTKINGGSGIVIVSSHEILMKDTYAEKSQKYNLHLTGSSLGKVTVSNFQCWSGKYYGRTQILCDVGEINERRQEITFDSGYMMSPKEMLTEFFVAPGIERFVCNGFESSSVQWKICARSVEIADSNFVAPDRNELPDAMLVLSPCGDGERTVKVRGGKWWGILERETPAAAIAVDEGMGSGTVKLFIEDIETAYLTDGILLSGYNGRMEATVKDNQILSLHVKGDVTLLAQGNEDAQGNAIEPIQ